MLCAGCALAAAGVAARAPRRVFTAPQQPSSAALLARAPHAASCVQRPRARRCYPPALRALAGPEHEPPENAQALRKRYSLGSGSSLKLSVQCAQAPGTFDITVWTDRQGRLLLHWGLLQPDALGWACPPAACLAELCPRGSVQYEGWAGGRALQTPLRASHDSGMACTLRLSADDAPDGVAFVLLDADTGAMLGCPDTGDAFVAPLELTWTSPPSPLPLPAMMSPPPPAPAANNAVAAAELSRSEQLTAAQRAARAGNPFTRLALADVQRQLSLADAVAVCRGIDTLLKQSEVQRRPSRARAAGADSKADPPGTLSGGDAR